MKSEDVDLCEELGQGAFGKVCKGILKVSSVKKKEKSTITVAVKMLQGMLQRTYAPTGDLTLEKVSVLLVLRHFRKTRYVTQLKYTAKELKRNTEKTRRAWIENT